MNTLKNNSIRQGSFSVPLKYFFILFLFSSCLLTGCGGDDDEDPAPTNTPTTPGSADDTTPPEIVSISPEDGASDVSINIAIEIELSERIDIETVKTGTVILSGGASSNLAWNWQMTGTSVTLTPDNPLQYGLEYLLRITSDVEDLAGNGFAETFSIRFTTESAPDDTPPTIQSITPSSNATGVSITSNITIVFSEDIDVSSIDDITVRNVGTSSNIGFTTDLNGEELTIDPSSNLDPNTEYAISIPTSVSDLAGNTLASSEESRFTTGNVAFTVTSSTPSANAEGFAIDDNISVTFSAQIDATAINNNTFFVYKSNNSSNNVSGNISVSGSTVTFTPTEPLVEYGSLYNIRISSNLKDVDGNIFETEQTISFYTEDFSYNYYYYIENADSDLRLIYDVNTSGRIFLGNPANINQQMWRFVNADNSNNERDAVANRSIGTSKLIEKTAPNDANDIFLSSRPASSTFYGGQRFTIRRDFGQSFRFEAPGEVLDGATLDMTTNTSYAPSKLWEFTRGPKI